MSEEWLQEKREAAISGTRNEDTDSKHLRKLPVKKDYCVFLVQVQNVNQLRGADPEQYVSNVRRVFTVNAYQNMCASQIISVLS